jgi:MFS family permease
MILISSFDPIQKNFNINYFELGLIVTIYYFFSFLGASFWSFQMSKNSRIDIIKICSIFWLVGIFFISFSKLYFMILIGSSFLGFSLESIPLITLNIIGIISNNNNKGFWNSLYWIFQGSGGVFGIFITGLLYGLYKIDWRIILCSIVLLLFIALLNIIKLVKRENELQINSDLIDTPIGIMKHDGMKFNFNQIFIFLKNKVNIVLIIYFLVYVPIIYFNNVWIQKNWIDIHNLSQSLASISMLFTSGGEFLGLIFGGFLIDKIMKKKKYSILFWLGIIVCFLSAPMFYFGYSIQWTIVNDYDNDLNFIQLCWFLFQTAIHDYDILISYLSLFIGFISISMIIPLYYTILMRENEGETLNIGINIIIILTNFGYFISPILGGILSDYMGLSFTLLLVVFLAIFLGTMYFILLLIHNRKIRKV